MIFKYTFETMLGTMTAYEQDNMLIRLGFDSEFEGVVLKTKLLENTKTQLTQYFSGGRKEFTLPLNPRGTSFQTRIWSLLREIPYGEVCSYQDIAVKYGNIKAVRAVGGANNKNPIMIIIPCHRVIGKKGGLVGYSSGIDTKMKLLELENKYK